MIADQAERLRRLIKRKELGIDVDFSTFMEKAASRQKRLIAFLGDKEEVLSTSSLVANCAVAIARHGKHVVILDAYPGKIDTSISLGVSVSATMESVMAGLCDIKAAMYASNERVTFVKMGDLLDRLETMEFKDKKNFFNQWMSLEETGDILIMNEITPSFSFALKEVFMVFSPAKGMVANAYAQLKQHASMFKGINVGFILNMAGTEKEAHSTADKFMATVRKFLHIDIEYVGYIPNTSEVIKAVKARVPYVIRYPYCPASAAVNLLVNKLIHGIPLIEKGQCHA